MRGFIFKKFTNWVKAGHPFKPVTQKFLSYFLARKPIEYTEGVDTDCYILKRGMRYGDLEEIDMNEFFNIENIFLANCHENRTVFTYVANKEDAVKFSKIGGESEYLGREGIEFYPQELMLFEKSELPSTATCMSLRNFQNPRSKYKLAQQDLLLEKEFLHPMIKGPEIKRFHFDTPRFIVPFPYDAKKYAYTH